MCFDLRILYQTRLEGFKFGLQSVCLLLSRTYATLRMCECPRHSRRSSDARNNK